MQVLARKEETTISESLTQSRATAAGVPGWGPAVLLAAAPGASGMHQSSALASGTIIIIPHLQGN